MKRPTNWWKTFASLLLLAVGWAVTMAFTGLILRLNWWFFMLGWRLL